MPSPKRKPPAPRLISSNKEPELRKLGVLLYGDLCREIDMLSKDAEYLPKSEAEYEETLRNMFRAAERIHQRIRDLIVDYRKR